MHFLLLQLPIRWYVLKKFRLHGFVVDVAAVVFEAVRNYEVVGMEKGVVGGYLAEDLGGNCH